jgi:hypothetical protein
MALPQQVVQQLNQGSSRSPGWSSGIILFAGSIFFIIIFIYAGLKFGYEPYLNSQLSSLQGQAQKLGQSVSASDEASLVTFYSQISNIQSLIKGHVFFSQFLTWLEQNTEGNIYYTNMSFASGDQITLSGVAKTSADITEQVAAFEASPNISSVTLSNVAFSSSANDWTFNAVLVLNSSILLWTPGASSPTVPMPASQATTPTTTPAATSSTAATSTASPVNNMPIL